MIEQASLVIGEGNWAVKSDSLLGYKINGGKYYPREMSVVRATTGTRINEDGLVELVPYNLFTYSEQFDNAAWVKERVTITANITTAPNGSLTADKIVEDNTTNSHRARQNAISEQGVQYTLSFYLKASERTKARITAGGLNAFANFDLSNGTIIGSPTLCAASIISADNGWYRCSITYTQTAATSAAQLHLAATLNAAGDFSYLGDGVSGIFVWGAQLVEGSVAKDYLPTTDRLDVARIDYSSGSGALLVEPQRTNLLTYSEDFGEWSASAGGISSIESNYAISPDGVINAYKVNFVVQNDSDLALYRGHSVTGGATYTYSIYIKGEGSNIGKDIVLKSKRSNGDSAGTTTTQTLTDEWVRVDFTTTYAANNTVANFYISSNDATSCLVYGAQAELGNYPTSYIPTQAATVTRNADVISKTGIADLIGQTEGTMFVGIYDYNFTPDNASPYLEIYADANNRITIFKNTSNQYQIFIRTVGVTTLSILTASILGNSKIAIGYKENDCVVYVNGVQVGTDTSVTIPTCSNVYLGQSVTGVSVQKDVFNAAALYKTRLTNAELATLTTI
jgi:hypothetical protein